MDVKIYDAEGNLQTQEWMKERYGEVLFLDGGAYPKYALTAVRETKGPAVVVASVRGENGDPIRAPVAFHWPNMDPETARNLTGGGLKTLYYPVGVFQYTEGSESSTGFGLGTGSYYWLPNHGCHTLWVLSSAYTSDGLDQFGMLGQTEHWGILRAEFTLMTSGTIPDPDPDPDPDPNSDEIVTLLQSIDSSLKTLVSHLGAN